MKVIERTARGFAPRKQKLHASAGFARVFGYGPGVVATGLGEKLLMRSWPDFAPIKGTMLAGEVRGGVVVGEHVLLAVAEMTEAPSVLAVHALDGGALVAKAAWPAGEALVDRAGGALVTVGAGGVTVWGVEVPAARAKRNVPA